MDEDGSAAWAPLTEGNCEPEPPTAGNDDVGAAFAEADGAAGADADGADVDGPLTDGNGELPLGCGCAAPPDTGGNAPCAHAAQAGAASIVSTMGTRSPREITIISLYRVTFYDPVRGLTTRRFRQQRGATPRAAGKTATIGDGKTP